MERQNMFLDWKNQYCQNDYTPKATYRFNTIHIKIPMPYFTELEQKKIELVWKHKDPEQPKHSLERKRAGGIRLPYFTLYYKTTVIKTVWHKGRNTDQWNRIEKLEVNSHT